jgi:YggT family protein
MDFDVVLIPFLHLVLSCIKIYRFFVIVYVLISMCASFNIINSRNVIVYSIHSALAQLIEPVLAPIKRMLPKTTMFDFSALILLLLLQFVVNSVQMMLLKYFSG